VGSIIWSLIDGFAPGTAQSYQTIKKHVPNKEKRPDLGAFSFSRRTNITKGL